MRRLLLTIAAMLLTFTALAQLEREVEVTKQYVIYNLIYMLIVPKKLFKVNNYYKKKFFCNKLQSCIDYVQMLCQNMQLFKNIFLHFIGNDDII